MKQNETLKRMLSDYRPDLGSNDEYLQRLSHKLEAIETCKRLLQTECQKNRRRLLVAFLSGSIGGALAILYIILRPLAPVAVPSLPFHFLDSLLRNADLLLNAFTLLLFISLSATLGLLFTNIITLRTSQAKDPHNYSSQNSAFPIPNSRG